MRGGGYRGLFGPLKAARMHEHTVASACYLYFDVPRGSRAFQNLGLLSMIIVPLEVVCQ